MESKTLIGDFAVKLERFPNLEKALSEFKAAEFKSKSSLERFNRINKKLLNFIRKLFIEKNPEKCPQCELYSVHVTSFQK